MKTIGTLILTLLMSSMALSQIKGINYKAVIKDNLGNVVANDLVVVQFTILKGVAQTNVYRENHTPTTDDNGIIILNIGEGSIVNGTFTSINWGNDNYFLNTQINTGAGLVDMGTTEFKTVPYALSAANVQGLEKIYEGVGTGGWRLIGLDPNNFGSIGSNAVDLSKSANPSTIAGATGNSATAFGANTIASGNVSTAMGIATTASGAYATSMGNLTTAFGNNSMATGAASNALGNNSTAMGLGTVATVFANTAIGLYNLGGGSSFTDWIATDPVLEIGNGTSSSDRSNALTILKNGTITAPSFDVAEIIDAKALITKEYADTNLNSTGLEAINEGNGTGWRIKGRNPALYGNIGSNAVDFSSSQEIINIGALGTYAFASGRDTRAQGGISTAMGSNTFASADASTAFGAYTIASGLASTSMGYYSNATGLFSMATGVSTIANAYNSTAIGSYNLGGGNATTWVATDPLLEIGNGTSSSTRSNAVTILKNGNMGIGISNPIARLHLNGRIIFGSSEFMEDGGSATIAFDGVLRSTLNGIDNLGTASFRWNTVYAVNGTINTSDSRDKTNISELSYGLKDILKLKPVSFNWKNAPNEDKKLGLIAQELLEIIPEVVKTHENIVIDEKDRTKTKSVEMDRMGVYYSDLIPVLIKSIQEQQEMIESLKARIELLEKQ